MNVLALLLSTIFSVALAANDPWLIDPASHVGAITRSSMDADLDGIFGKQNLRRQIISIGEGFRTDATIVYAGTSNELVIVWNEKTHKPEKLIIYGKSTKWKTIQGITVDTPIREVEKINGSPFKITGLGWDYPARSTSWEGGKLPQELQLDFFATAKISEPEMKKVRGDRDFSTQNPIMKKQRMAVKAINIRW